MSFSKVLWSSKSGEWSTPQEVFDWLNEEYGPFTLDVCATPENAKCDRYFTKADDGLKQNWGGETFFMNPPFSIPYERPDGSIGRRRVIHKWVRKAYKESLKPGTLGVCLLPARTGPQWFHNYVVHGEIVFLQGRLRFGGHEGAAPFDHMIVIFGRHRDGEDDGKVPHSFPKMRVRGRIWSKGGIPYEPHYKAAEVHEWFRRTT